MEPSQVMAALHSAPSSATLFAALAILVLVARALGGLAARLGQPAVLGEVSAGVLLGATVLGRLWPEAAEAFASQGQRAALAQFSQVALVLFMLSAGLELDMGMMWRERRRSALVGAAGLLAPFVVGFASAWLGFDWFRGSAAAGRAELCFLFATALSVTALPVIVKILADLRLLGTNLAAIIITSAVLDDLAGWALLGIALALGNPRELNVALAPCAVGYAALLLRFGPRALAALLARMSGWGFAAGAELALVLAVAGLNAALAELLGLHGVFGAFLTGLCLARSRALAGHTRELLVTLGTQVCAPLFFATVALHVDMARAFDPLLVLAVCAVASSGKIAGCWAAARLTGLGRQDSLAIAFSMNARGAMEIVFGQLALQRGLIDPRLFVALVVMALATSMAACGVLRFVTLAPRELELNEAPRPAAV